MFRVYPCNNTQPHATISTHVHQGGPTLLILGGRRLFDALLRLRLILSCKDHSSVARSSSAPRGLWQIGFANVAALIRRMLLLNKLRMFSNLEWCACWCVVYYVACSSVYVCILCYVKVFGMERKVGKLFGAREANSYGGWTMGDNFRIIDGDVGFGFAVLRIG